MNPSALRATGVLLLMCVPAALPVRAAPVTRTFSLGPFGSLELVVPEGWKATMQGPKSDGGTAIRFEPSRDVPFVGLMTPIPNLKEGNEFDPPKQALAIAEAIRGKLRSISVEEEVRVRTIRGPECVAHYVSITDRTVIEPTRKDFRYCTQGAATIGRLLVTFTLLTNLEDPPEFEQALEMLRTGRHIPPSGGPEQNLAGTVRLKYPGKSWALLVDLPGFAFKPLELRDDHSGVRLEGTHPVTEVMATIFLEAADSGRTAEEYRDWAWEVIQRTAPAERVDVRNFQRGQIALREFRVPAYLGMDVNQKHVNAYLVHDGVWIDVHISKGRYRPEDEALLDRILASVRFSD